MLEICSFSLESCLTAQKAGADRVELCGGMFEGGTTPSAGLVSLVRQNLTIKLFVMEMEILLGLANKIGDYMNIIMICAYLKKDTIYCLLLAEMRVCYMQDNA